MRKGKASVNVFVHFAKADVRIHMPVDVLFRKHEVHAVAGGLIVEAPLESGTVEGKLIEKVIDDGGRYSLVLGLVVAGIREIVVTEPVAVGTDPVIGQGILDIVADQFMERMLWFGYIVSFTSMAVPSVWWLTNCRLDWKRGT